MATYTLNELNTLEVRPHVFVSEASELRFPILMSEWPWTITTKMGNGQPLKLKAAYADRFVYMQALGCITLEVFND